MLASQLLGFINSAGAVLAIGIFTATTLVHYQLLRQPKLMSKELLSLELPLQRFYWAGVVLFVLSDIALAATPGKQLDALLFPAKELFVACALMATAYLAYSVMPKLRQVAQSRAPKAKALGMRAVVLRALGMFAWYSALLIAAFL